MLRAAVEGDPLLEVSTVELDRKGPSFTVETVEILSAANAGVPLYLILGADQWCAFGRWHRPAEIARMASIVLMARGGELPSEMDPGFEDGPPPSFAEVAVTRMDISSSLVRERIAGGRSVRYLVSGGVREIIEREKLYLSE
jgi:nicotinate-nucleotide adenylyltransferase